MWQRNYVTLSTGERVRYALLDRKDADTTGYYVRFRDAAGKRVKRSTGQAKKPQAIEAAHRLILEEYQQVAPSAERMTWEAAKEKLRDALEADGKRPATVKGYMETIDKLVGLLPFGKGPADVTEKMAEDFKTKYAKGKFVRHRDKEGAPAFPRKAKSLDSRLRTLKAVFSWFKKIRLVEGNPFRGVSQPELDRHEVKFVRETDVGQFFDWLEMRYPGWRMPALFFTVKALTGCRLDDLCSIGSKQLQDGRLVFSADGTKNRSERFAVLPAEVFEELRWYAGKAYVWQRYPAELKAEIEKKHAPTHRLNPEFSPRRLYLWVVALMQEYQKETGSDLSSHDFRRAAFTRAAEDDIHPKRAAVAFDVTPETMMRYYTATEKKQTADDVLGSLASRLVPKDRTRGR